MKKVLIHCLWIVALLGWHSAYTLEVKSGWNIKFQKEVTLSCSEGEYLCEDLCEKSTCKIQENFCRNCIGNTVYLTHFFDYLGKSYVNSGDEVTTDEFLALIKSGNFASMTSKTIYNHVEKYNGENLRSKFQSLCEGDEYPMVFFKVNPTSKRPETVEYVLCRNTPELQIFRMDDRGDMLVEGE